MVPLLPAGATAAGAAPADAAGGVRGWWMRGRPPLRRGALPPAPPVAGSAAAQPGLVPLLQRGEAAAAACSWLLGPGLAWHAESGA